MVFNFVHVCCSVLLSNRFFCFFCDLRFANCDFSFFVFAPKLHIDRFCNPTDPLDPKRDGTLLLMLRLLHTRVLALANESLLSNL